MARVASRLSRADVIKIAIISAVFTAIYVTVILPLLSSLIPFDLALRKFDFRQNEWFEARDVRIIDKFSPSLAVANDEMFYDINYRNLKDHEIAMESELQIMFAGKVVDTLAAPKIKLPVGGSGKHEIRFFSNYVGENQLILNVSISNATDSSLLGVVSGTINVPVYSAEAAAQEAQNRLTLTGLLVSIPVSYITIITVVVTLILTRRQTEGLREQIRIARNSFNDQLLTKWKEDYKEHSKKLSEIIFNGWLKSKEFFARCNYDNEEFFCKEPSTPQIPNMPQATDHLTKGYPDTWQTFLEAQAESIAICKQMKELIESFQAHIRNELKAKCPELLAVEGWSPHINNSLYEKRLFYLIFQRASERTKGGKNEIVVSYFDVIIEDDEGNKNNKKIMILQLNGTDLATGDEPILKRLKSLIFALISSDEILEYLKKYGKLASKLKSNDKFDRHEKAIRAIWERAFGGGLLEKPGSCDLCPKQPEMV